VPSKGPSTRVRICVRIADRFRAGFVRNHKRDPILLLAPITMVISVISATFFKKNYFLDTFGSKSYTDYDRDSYGKSPV
jgi:hypothetical protein